MIQTIWLLVRRLFIFALGLGLAYATVFYVFPFIDARLPVLLSLLATYCLLAYIGIPTFIRVFRLFEKPNHVPTCSTTSDGWASDPINIAVLAKNEQEFIRAMVQAGWYKADKKNFRNDWREFLALLFNRPYPTAPFSNLYLFGRKQDLGFQIPVGNSPRIRHHVRFWRVEVEEQESDHEHLGFWRTLFKHFLRRKQQLWVGAAIFDSYPIGVRWRNAQLTHLVHPDADYERDFLIKSLEEAGVLKIVSDIKAGEPYRGRGQSIGVTVISDGFVKLCELKRPSILPK